mgnify:CR=1 FL=1
MPSKMPRKEIRIPIDLVTGLVFALFALMILLVMPDQVAISEKDVVIPRMYSCGQPVTMSLYSLTMLFTFSTWDQVAISEKDVVNGRAFPTLLMTVMLLCCAMLITHRITLSPGMAAKTEPINTPRLIHKMFSNVNSGPRWPV